MLQNKVFKAAKMANLPPPVLSYVQLTIHTLPSPNPTLQKAYLASFSVDHIQKPWLDAELLIMPQLLGGR